MLILLLFSAWALAGTMPALGTETSTLGQPVIGIAEGSSWTVYSGFWYVEPLSGIEEAPNTPDINPPIAPKGVYRVGEAIPLEAGAAVYDATGRLLEHPEASWIPGVPGVYFLKTETQIQKVVVVR
ncbi:hypothetical protein CEE36_05020 [candidate division TA06 bacterium B3_TA06]|uniref:Secretion system C-terminal sorting domain-containing protein n=1 Tax=candidate division TA06 bacterium B3_TA06 TaxID=2012487 RepID=A0A532V7J7_UNCT6|nr:MAG: hypothetical protein CEE36_05020 [candidate division TA06 bacterium B3_TA06]